MTTNTWIEIAAGAALFALNVGWWGRGLFERWVATPPAARPPPPERWWEDEARRRFRERPPSGVQRISIDAGAMENGDFTFEKLRERMEGVHVVGAGGNEGGCTSLTFAPQGKTRPQWSLVVMHGELVLLDWEALDAKRAASAPGFRCPECGPCAVDEDGCCTSCGADAPAVHVGSDA